MSSNGSKPQHSQSPSPEENPRIIERTNTRLLSNPIMDRQLSDLQTRHVSLSKQLLISLFDCWQADLNSQYEALMKTNSEKQAMINNFHQLFTPLLQEIPGASTSTSFDFAQVNFIF
jgi:hypothetical protein